MPIKEQRKHGYTASIQQIYNSLIKYNRPLEIMFSEIDIQWLQKDELWVTSVKSFKLNVADLVLLPLSEVKQLFNEI